MPPLTVVSFNIRNGRGLDGTNVWWLRRRATLAALRGLAPDVAGLQEVRPLQRRWLVRHLRDDYVTVGRGRDDGRHRGEHCLVLVRRSRLRVERTETRWYSDSPGAPGSRGWGNHFPRVATLVWLSDREDQRRFGLANTHWDEASQASRDRSAAALAGWVTGSPIPWIVLGDFNATVENGAVRSLLATAGLNDTLGELPADGAGAATNHDYSGRSDGTRIDLILVSGGWVVESSRIDRTRPGGRLPSDHWPVVATLRRTPPAE